MDTAYSTEEKLEKIILNLKEALYTYCVINNINHPQAAE